MMQIPITDRRIEHPRYIFELPIRAEWRGQEYETQLVRAEGHTANVGPRGTLVHLRPLPPVGSLVHLFISHDEAPSIPYYEVETFVLRVDHDAGEPLAALMVSDWLAPGGAWLNRVYEPSVAAIRAALEAPFTYSAEEDAEEGEEGDPESWSCGRVRKGAARETRTAPKGNRN